MLNTKNALLVQKALLYLLSACLALTVCSVLFWKTDILAYRLVTAFLVCIFISNLGAALATSYFEDRV